MPNKFFSGYALFRVYCNAIPEREISPYKSPEEYFFSFCLMMLIQRKLGGAPLANAMLSMAKLDPESVEEIRERGITGSRKKWKVFRALRPGVINLWSRATINDAVRFFYSVYDVIRADFIRKVENALHYLFEYLE